MRNKRIILADMDTATRTQLANALNIKGLTVYGQTADGEELLRLCHLEVDLVVMDLVLSSVDGLTVLEQLHRKKPAPQILVLSGFVGGGVAVAAARYTDYFMLKPCKTELVVERIVQLLSFSDTDNASALAPVYLERTVTDIMHDFGIPAHIKGYQYLRDAIIRATRNFDVMDAVTKTLYPDIAKCYHTTSSRVERGIRHAIETAWTRGSLETLHQYFGYTVSAARGKPTNSEFIAQIACQLQLQTKWA